MKTSSLTRIAVIAVASLLAASTHAQTLLYGWNFDNATGSGATLGYVPSAIGAGQTGGNLANNVGGLNGSTSVFASGPGLTGGADLGLVGTGTYGGNTSNAGQFGGDLTGFTGSLSQLTLTLWFNPSVASEQFGRLLEMNTNSTAASGNLIYLAFSGGNRLQFQVNNFNPNTQGQNITASTYTFTPGNWYFIGVTYDSAVGSSVYVGTTSTAATLLGTLSATGGGPVNFSSTDNYISVISQLGALARSSDGTLDNLNIYSGAGNQAFIQGVQGVPEPGTGMLAGLGGLALLAVLCRRQAGV